MAVFTVFADDSTVGNRFILAGFMAPILDWNQWFIPAWEERVLNRKPAIPYFHTAELSDPENCMKLFGLTWGQADDRIEEASCVIGSMGSLVLISAKVDESHFDRHLSDCRLIMPGPQPGAYPMEPDYFAFRRFVLWTLDYVEKHRPQAEKVDFVIERKQTVSRYLPDFYEAVKTDLIALGRQSQLELMGELIPGDKNRVPLQAADCACWHLQKMATGRYTSAERRRALRIARRKGNALEMTNDDIEAMADQIRRANRPSPFPSKQKRQVG
jgi:hypothetical protein